MPNQRDEFTTFDIIKALGIPRERLQDWINRDFIKPTIPAEGQGTKAIFTIADVYCIALFSDFLTVGFNRKTASTLSKNLRKYFEIDRKMGYLCIRISIKGGTRRAFTFSWSEEKVGLLNLKTGGPPVLPGAEFTKKGRAVKKILRDSDEWGQMHLINIGLLRRKVDMALSGLE